MGFSNLGRELIKKDALHWFGKAALEA